MNKKILILIGGGEGPLEPFLAASRKLKLDVVAASFTRLSYFLDGKKNALKVNGKDLASFDVVYLRVVGKRQEDAALVVEYLKDKKTRIADSIFHRAGLVRLPLSKSLEARLLEKAGLPIPKTYFGSLKMIEEEAPKLFGYPLVIKGTTGKQGHAVWSPRDKGELIKLIDELKEQEKTGKRFIAQEFIKASQRSRILVIGSRAVAGITRPTRWRKRFLNKDAEGRREALSLIPKQDAELAIRAAKSLGIEIAGVDVIHEDETGRPYVLEVNSAPRWAAIEKDAGINVAEEILKYLSHL